MVKVVIQARRGVVRIRFAGRACMQLLVEGPLSDIFTVGLVQSGDTALSICLVA
jgi:hypothetical protein